MKTELIEHHRKRAKFYENRASTFPSGTDACMKANGRMIFHERAVAWLESLDVEEQHESERRCG